MSESLKEQIQEAYQQSTPKARSYFEGARNYIPGGVTRTLSFFQPYPLYVERGEGFKIFDVDGNERIDFFNNATALILGHAHPAVVEAVQEQVAKGTSFHAPTIYEVGLAKILCERVESVEKLRFTNSGSEACMYAMRGAKAFTGKTKIAKFEGGYHGNCDHALVSVHPDLSKAGPPDAPVGLPECEGIAESILKEVVLLPFNNIDGTANILKREKDDLACVIVEPMLGAGGSIPAQKDFLLELRRITEEYGILLIFDEVQTFRFSWGGAQELYNVVPDMTAFGKIIGGGFPVGAFGGKKDIMEVFDSSKGKARVGHAGTFNGNPITTIAGKTVLEQLTPETFTHLNQLGADLRKGLTALFEKYNYEATVSGASSFFKVHFTRDEIANVRDAERAVNKEEQHKLYLHLLNGGIFAESLIRGNISVPMEKPQIDQLLDVVEDYLKKHL